MKSFLILAAIVLGFSFNSLGETIHIRNNTTETIFVRVRFNSGTGCAVTEDVVVCVLPLDGATVGFPGLSPFSVLVMEGCASPDMSTLSWRHNNLLLPGCTAGPVFSETPYLILWTDMPTEPAIDWAVIVNVP